MATVNGHEVNINKISKATDQICTFDLKIKGTYTTNIFVCRYPTNNCQLSCIGSMCNLVHLIAQKEDVQAIIRECYRLMSLNSNLLIIVDVQQTYISQIEACFQIKHKAPYISSNGHNMCLFIVQM